MIAQFKGQKLFLAFYFGIHVAFYLIRLPMCIHHQLNPWKFLIPHILKHLILHSFHLVLVFSIKIHKSTSNKGSRKWVRVWGPIVIRRCYIVWFCLSTYEMKCFHKVAKVPCSMKRKKEQWHKNLKPINHYTHRKARLNLKHINLDSWSNEHTKKTQLKATNLKWQMLQLKANRMQNSKQKDKQDLNDDIWRFTSNFKVL